MVVAADGHLCAQTLSDIGTTAPTPGTYDISQLSISGNQTAPDGLNYYTDNQTGHGTGEPGQTFTTGTNPSGYLVTSVAFRTGGLGSTTYNGIGTAQPYYLHIYSVSGSTATLLQTYASGNITFNDGDWLKWSGLVRAVVRQYHLCLFLWQGQHDQRLGADGRGERQSEERRRNRIDFSNLRRHHHREQPRFRRRVRSGLGFDHDADHRRGLRVADQQCLFRERSDLRGLRGGRTSALLSVAIQWRQRFYQSSRSQHECAFLQCRRDQHRFVSTGGHQQLRRRDQRAGRSLRDARHESAGGFARVQRGHDQCGGGFFKNAGDRQRGRTRRIMLFPTASRSRA